MEGGPNIQEDENLISTSSSDHWKSYLCGCFCCETSTSDYHALPTTTAPNRGCWFAFSDPRGSGNRFIALIFMCFLGFGSYFCYDSPSALENHFQEDLNMTTTQYGMINSMYSWPNVVLCFFGGFLIDRVFGIRLGTNIYMLITLFGQIVFAAGVYVDTLWLIFLGRLVFGIGAESLAVAQNNYAVLWFKGKELNMVFGLQLSFARVGSSVSILVMESVYVWVNRAYTGPQGLGLVLLIAGSTCLFSMLCAIILGLMDKRAERILQRGHGAASGEVARLTDVKDFKATFWLMTIICVTYYVAIFPFISFGKEFFMNRFKMSDTDANSVNSLIYLVSGVASPILGLVIDKVGKNVFWIMSAVVFTIGAHSMLAFTLWNPYIGVVIMGVAYSCLASSLWPLVSLIIPEYQLGTAYGVCQAVQNFGLAVFQIAVGALVAKGYFWSEVFFITSLGVCFLTSIVIWILDSKRGGVLNMAAWKRREQANLIKGEESRDLLDSEEATSSGGLEPNSNFHIRNRYLSRIGAPVSDLDLVD